MTVLTPTQLIVALGSFSFYFPKFMQKPWSQFAGPDAILEVRKPWILAFASYPAVFTRWMVLGGLKSRILTLISKRKLVKNKPV